MKSIKVYIVSVSFPYQDKEEGMVERSLQQEFLADNDSQAIDVGIAWAYNRYKQVIKDYYDKSIIGCIKVGTKAIGRGEKNGFINTHSEGRFFEWKCDWPGTLEQWANSKKAELKGWNN